MGGGLEATLAAGGVGAAGWLLAGYFIRQIFTGKWIPVAEVDKVVAAANLAVDKAEHDRDEWRTESRLKDAQIAEKDKQLGYLEEVGRLMTAVMTALRRLAGSSEVGT